MDRREFLTAKLRSKQKKDIFSVAVQNTAGLEPYGGNFGAEEVIHLLNRTMFGASVPDIMYFLNKNMSTSVDELVYNEYPMPTPPIKDYGFKGSSDYNVPDGTPWVNYTKPDMASHTYRLESFKGWWAGCLIQQKRSVFEKMTLFWHNHFSTQLDIYMDAQLAYKHLSLLRQYALGNYKMLTTYMTVDPSMLIFLNGISNKVNGANENYARELQELFTLGKENSPNYTEDDVKAIARVLTGWKAIPDELKFEFEPADHDPYDKQFSSFYGNKIIKGRRGNDAGAEEALEMLEMIFAKKKEISVFIVQKIYRWFCYYNIDAFTQANIIEPLAKIFVDSNWEIKPVLATLFKSRHFYDISIRGAQIKSPVEFVTGMMRQFNIKLPNVATNYVDHYALLKFLYDYSANMGQPMGNPPGVAGWPAYYQPPLYQRMWINVDNLQKRQVFVNDLLNVNLTLRDGTPFKLDAIAFAKQLPNPDDPTLLLEHTLLVLYAVPMSAAAKLRIKKQILLSNQDSDYYWTNEWNKHIANPSDAASYQIVNSRLMALFKYLLNLAEYNLT
jgi:uncharacterized protein (DUF1800 family)